MLSRAEEADEEDPVLGAFLAFLAHDIASHPERLAPLSNDLLASMKKATHEAGDIDLDSPLSADDE